MITTRPQSGTTLTILPSNHDVGDEVMFVPASQIPHVLITQGIMCKVVGVTFEQSMVLYDLALPAGPFDYYEKYPLMRVDSIFVFNKLDP